MESTSKGPNFPSGETFLLKKTVVRDVNMVKNGPFFQVVIGALYTMYKLHKMVSIDAKVTKVSSRWFGLYFSLFFREI